MTNSSGGSIVRDSNTSFRCSRCWKRDFAIGLSCCGLVWLGIAAATAQDGPPRRVATEKSLGKADLSKYDPQRPAFWISPDGRRIACLVEKGIAIDGKAKTYEYGVKDETFTFSPDSQRTGYVAKVGGMGGRNEVLVIDGKQQKVGYSSIRPGPVFSPDSKHVASIARLSASSFDQTMLIDGRESEERYEGTNWELAYTPDSKRVIYAVEIDDKFRMREDSVDGSEPRIERMHGPATLIGNFFYGPQGQVGYIASADEHQFVVYEGKDDGHRFKEVDRRSIVISGDGKQIAYVGEPATFASAPVIGGELGKTYQGLEGDIIDRSLSISPDGKRSAYSIKSSSKHCVVVDGKPGKVYSRVGGAVFSPDSKYAVYQAISNNKLMLVLDGREGAGYDKLGMPEFNPQSDTLAYWAEAGGRQFMVINGKKQKPYDNVGTPVFSPDGKRLAFLAEAGGKWLLVENGKEGKTYDDIDGNLYFSPDSRHLATVFSEGDQQVVVVNGSEGPRFDTIVTIAGGEIHFDGEGRMHYLATRGDEIILVEETLE